MNKMASPNPRIGLEVRVLLPNFVQSQYSTHTYHDGTFRVERGRILSHDYYTAAVWLDDESMPRWVPITDIFDDSDEACREMEKRNNAKH